MTPWPYPLWLAHRGAGKLAPENTLAAFRVGVGFGYRAFECDVKLSRDGEAFLLHDDTLERTSSGLGSPADVDWVELARLDAGGWHSPPFAAEPLPRLAQIAAFCLANGCALNIEIKPCPGAERLTGEVAAREAERLWAGNAVPPLLSSFKTEALLGARAAAPALPRALLLDKLWDGWQDAAEALGVVAVITNWRLMDSALIDRLHAKGWRALVYTVNDSAVAERLITDGIDGLITDRVDALDPR
ncbi:MULTISPECIES: glycerophosphodiester phosphodiesterase [unclassified Roseateles]|uniref:glycerophosphodiester phosphodiesterase n=1 Tax=unclassified Roseateles TaxID=2626991 RepID=UPI000701264A|nr:MULTISPECIES: glycerophosphodiester phosphodiesterase [unclassified Roseateles]KQW41996.1 glycerophosphodiester phosphodiesterase [Pelomonas sp. Root405]KRA67599.1 glycerophosphodiester phosphodiesterase [Pelomonas sp. Root662]